MRAEAKKHGGLDWQVIAFGETAKPKKKTFVQTEDSNFDYKDLPPIIDFSKISTLECRVEIDILRRALHSLETLKLDMPPDELEATIWAVREAFVRVGGIESTAAQFFLNHLELPKLAPKLYANRPKDQNIIGFLQDPDGWGPYVKAGVLTRVELGRRDPQAYRALANWLRDHKLPSDLKIPKKEESVTATLGNNLGDKDSLRARRRLLRAHERRLASPPR